MSKSADRRKRTNYGPDFCGYVPCNRCFADLTDNDAYNGEDAEIYYRVDGSSKYYRERSERIHFEASFAQPDAPMPSAADIERVLATGFDTCLTDFTWDNVKPSDETVVTDQSRDIIDARPVNYPELVWNAFKPLTTEQVAGNIPGRSSIESEEYDGTQDYNERAYQDDYRRSRRYADED